MSADLLIRNITRHVELTNEEQSLVNSMVKPRTLRRRQYLLQAGDISRHENFVVKGCLRSYYVDSHGNEHTVQFAIEDWWIGDLASFVLQAPAKLNVEAIEDCEVLQIDYQNLEELYRKVPKMERFFRLLIQRSFIVQQNRIISMSSKSAEERYLEFVEKYPYFKSRLPQTKIASYLGITPEFLSKIRNNLAKASR